jgi:hypothetical protein
MTPLLWFILTANLLLLAKVCIETTKITRGAGSWATDEQLKYLAGVLLGWAFVTMAMGIAQWAGVAL